MAFTLTESVLRTFTGYLQKDARLTRLMALVRAGKATYANGHEIAIRIGSALEKAYKLNVYGGALPEGMMFAELATELLGVPIETGRDIVDGACISIQEALNAGAGIGLAPVTPEVNADRVQGLITRLCGGELYDDISWLLENGTMTNIMQSRVDDFVKENARLHEEVGLDPVIVRKTNGKCCAWCDRLEGTYPYNEVSNTGNDVFRRHERCRCVVTYDPRDGGKSTNVWSKR